MSSLQQSIPIQRQPDTTGSASLRHKWIQLIGWVVAGASGMLPAFARSKRNPTRRFAPLVALAATLLHGPLVRAAEPLAIGVHRGTNCSYCRNWIKHLGADGFKATDHVEVDMNAVKSRLGIPYSMGSCHTGVINGKFIEGHVSAADTLKLRERTDLVSAAIPDMSVDSPGMEMGDRQDAYQAVGLTRSGQTSVLVGHLGHQRKHRFPQGKRRFSL